MRTLLAAPAVDWHLLDLLTSVGLLLGILGSLYLSYDLLERQSKTLREWIGSLSAGFIVASVPMTLYVLLLGPDLIVSGASSGEVWRVAWSICFVAVIGQRALFFPPSTPSPPVFIWRHFGWSAALTGGLLVVPVVGFAEHTIWKGVIVILSGVLMMGILSGFSESLQWRANHLPKNRLAVVGAILILCAFVLILVQPMVGLLEIPIH